MSFIAPAALLALLLIPAALLLRGAWRRRRGRDGVPHPNVDTIALAAVRPRGRRYVPLALAMLAIAALAVALARPQLYRDEPRERATIMLAIDVSGSMAAEDVEPYRLRAAQDAALTFADSVPRAFQLGLVSFSGEANVLLPPTTDRAAFERSVESLVPDGATAIGDAVAASLDAIRQTQGGVDTEAGEELEASRILLLSDGSSTAGLPVSAAADEASRAGVPVFTVALGTLDGILDNGQRVPPDVPALRDLAESTDGQAFESRDAESVSAVYERLGSFIGTERVLSEVTAWPAGIAAGLLVLAALGAWRLSPRVP
jgi:Ca-activated chloride channel family protein